MEAAIEFFVEQGSYLLMFAALLIAGLGVPFPEDIVMISGAILVQRGINPLWTTVLVLALGVFAGDSLLYYTARRVGPAVYKWKLVSAMVSPERRRWLEEKIDRHGGLVVFFARHVAGFRGPTFALAAIHGISYPRFIFWDMLALAISLPLWMGLGWFFGDSLQQLTEHTVTAERLVLVVVLSLILLIVVAHAIVGAVKRARLRRAAASGAEEPEGAPPAAEP